MKATLTECSLEHQLFVLCRMNVEILLVHGQISKFVPDYCCWEAGFVLIPTATTGRGEIRTTVVPNLAALVSSSLMLVSLAVVIQFTFRNTFSIQGRSWVKHRFSYL